MKSTTNSRQSGAVSLFLVIIAMLLISVVTIGFLRLMISNQTQATNSDLSQSALDSAQAGVEDAKRALLRYKQRCLNDSSLCTQADVDKFAKCNMAMADVVDSSAISPGKDATSVGEIRIQQTANASNDSKLDQAYTCVTVELNTEDYIGGMTANGSQLVPLVSTKPFDKVTVEWFSTEDISSGNTALVIPGSAGAQPLSSAWRSNTPSVLRAQLIQYTDANLTLNSFDTTTPSGQSNANTLFLYPHSTGINSSVTNPIEVITRDVRTNDPLKDSPKDTSGDSPLPIRCKSSLASGGYACSATLRFPDPVGGSSTTRVSFLRLTAFYNATHFRVTLPETPMIKFDTVQPEIDSTGRANNLFRRVQTRVDMYDTTFPYPEAAVDVTGNFCKDFGVTNTRYIPGSPPCTP